MNTPGLSLLPLVVMPAVFFVMLLSLVAVGEARPVPAPAGAAMTALAGAITTPWLLDSLVVEALLVSVAVSAAYPAADRRLSRRGRLASVALFGGAAVGIGLRFENTVAGVLSVTLPACVFAALLSGYLSRRWPAYGAESSGGA
jgi:hypothetical protein